MKLPDMKRSTLIIAEAGINHNGSIEMARQLISAAANAGADAVKFQTFRTESLVTKRALKADYQKKAGRSDESQYEMLRKVELDHDSHRELMSCCVEKGVMFLSSPFDLESIDFLDALGLEMFKIPSGEITNLPYLRRMGCLRKKVLLSTGMSNLGEIEDALEVLTAAGTNKDDITVLHCNTEYPTSMSDVNLRAMNTIKQAFQVRVGYSDHTLGIEIPIAAVALGASVIEKHFTLDKTLDGADHKASLDADEFRAMVNAIRNTELAMGESIKKPSHGEAKNIEIVRKSIVAAREIKKGEILSEKNLTTKRPGSGINPMRWDDVIGKKAPRDFQPDDMIILT